MDLPNELWKLVISYLDLKSAQNIALTSKKMHQLSMMRLWSKPRYTKNTKDIAFLHKISNFSIRELHTSDFSCKWLEILGLVPQLRLLHVDNAFNYHFKPDKAYLRFLKISVIVHTKALEIWENFEELLDILCSIKIQSLVIDHDSRYYQRENLQRYLTFEEFKLLSSKVCISEVHTDCIEWDSGNILDFIELLSTMRDCSVYLYNHNHLSTSLYTVKHLELMVALDIKIVYIESEGLNFESCPILLEMVKVMKKMRHLKEFRFYDCDFKTEFRSEVGSLVDLPIKSMSTSFFVREEGKIGDIVDTLLRMKSLNQVTISEAYETDHMLSPEELILFKELPVKEVFLEALNLTPQNIPEFRQVLKQMKIAKIHWITGYFETLGFEVSVEEFIDESNGLIYKTIG
ncbi:uncharacterized protein [Clytia hemisphaerica]|uniref:uncharacterized protein n=1 Tax=Clytia hemisphaerica TaxID=252671 RepID=UPI0034D5071F